MNPLDFPTSADEVDSGVMRVKTRAIVPPMIVAQSVPLPAPVAPVPGRVAVVPPVPPRAPAVASATGGLRSWWWLALLVGGGYLVWRNQRKKR